MIFKQIISFFYSILWMAGTPKQEQKVTTKSFGRKQDHRTSRIIAMEKEKVTTSFVEVKPSGQKQKRGSATLSQKRGRVNKPDSQKRKEVALLLQKGEEATDASVKKEEEIPGIANQEKKVALQENKERFRALWQKYEKEAVTSEQKHKAIIATSVQKQEKTIKTPVQEEKRENVLQTKEGIVGTCVQKKKGIIEAGRQGTVESSSKGKGWQTEVSCQKQGKTISMQKREEAEMHTPVTTVTQEQEGTVKVLVTKKERTPVASVENRKNETITPAQKQERTSGAHVHKQEIITTILTRKRKEMPTTQMQRQESVTGTLQQKQKGTPGTPMRSQEGISVQKRKGTPRTPVQKQEEITGTPMQRREKTTGTVPQKQEKTVENELQKETIAKKQNEGTIPETSVQEGISGTPVQIQEATKSVVQMQKEADASEDDKLQVSDISLMQTEPTCYLRPPTALFLPPSDVQFGPIEMQVESAGGPLYYKVPQQYGLASVPPFPQQAEMQITETPVYGTVSVPPYPLQPNTQIVETQSGPLYRQVPQQYGSVPLIPRFPPPVPGLPASSMVGIPKHSLPGQVISQFPPTLPGLAAPVMARIPAEPLPGQIRSQFPRPVPRLAVLPRTGIPTHRLPSQIRPRFPPSVPGLAAPPMAGSLPGEVVGQFLPSLPAPPMARIPDSGEALQQFNAPHPGQFQLAPESSMFSGFSQYNQPYFQFPPGPFPGFQQYGPHSNAAGVVVSEVNVNLLNQSLTLQETYSMNEVYTRKEIGTEKEEAGTGKKKASRKKKTNKEANTKTEDEPVKKKEVEPTANQIKFIYGEGSMLRLEVPASSKQSKITLWPRARKHRRDKLVIKRQAEMIQQLFLHGLSDLVSYSLLSYSIFARFYVHCFRSFHFFTPKF